MELSLNLTNIKAELTRLGISTATPGLVGDDRYEELKHRLHRAHNIIEHDQFAVQQDSVELVGSQQRNDVFVVPSMSGLSIGELRSRLSVLGIDTSTPGLSGEERKQFLMKRLVQAICGGENERFDDMIDEIGTISLPSLPPVEPEPSAVEEKQPEESIKPAENTKKVPLNRAPPPMNDIILIDPSANEISELKRDLKRLLNRKAMVIAAKLSGPEADPELKENEKFVSKLDVELSRLRLVKAANPNTPASSVLLLGSGMMTVEKLVSKLETLKNETKEKIRIHRLEIREAADLSDEYGLDAEKELNERIKSAQYVKGRTRRKIDELKSLGKKSNSNVIVKTLNQAGASTADNAAGQLSARRNSKQELRKPSVGKIDVDKLPEKKRATTTRGGSDDKEDEFDRRLQMLEKQSDSHKRSLDDLLDELNEQELFNFDSTDLSASKGMDTIDKEQLKNKVKENAMKSSADSSKIMIKRPPLPAYPHPDDVKNAAQPNNKGYATATTPTPRATAGSVDTALLPAATTAAATNSTAVNRHHQESLLSEEKYHGNDDDDDDDDDEEEEEEDSRKYKTNSQLVSSQEKGFQTSDSNNSGKFQFLDDDEDEEKANSIIKKYSKSNVSGGTEDDDSDDDDSDDSIDRKLKASIVQIKYEAAQAKKSASAAAIPVQESKAAIIKSKSSPIVNPKSVAAESIDDDDDDDDNPVLNRNDVKHNASKYSNEKIAMANDVKKTPVKSVMSPIVTGPIPENPQALSDLSDEEERENTAYIRLANSISSGAVLTPRSNIKMSPIQNDASPVRRPVSPVISPPIVPPPPINNKKTRDQHISPITNQVNNENKNSSNHASMPDVSNNAKSLQYDDDDGDDACDEDNEDDEDLDKNDEIENDDEREVYLQVKALQQHAKVLEKLGDTNNAESLYERALELDPLDIQTLTRYAVFLHHRRGELTRAESFFKRAIQSSIPSIYQSIINNSPGKNKSVSSPSAESNTPDIPPPNVATTPTLKVRYVTKLLLHYASFLTRAKGDVEIALLLYRKALEINPNDADVIGAAAHFLSTEGFVVEGLDPCVLFAKSLKINPNNPLHAMWYAKALKSKKSYNEAEIMYQVALAKSKSSKKLEPTAICNYATFLYKYRKNSDKSCQYFINGLELYPDHKGLLKNYTLFIKANPLVVQSSEEYSKKSRVILAQGKGKHKKTLETTLLQLGML